MTANSFKSAWFVNASCVVVHTYVPTYLRAKESAKEAEDVGRGAVLCMDFYDVRGFPACLSVSFHEVLTRWIVCTCFGRNAHTCVRSCTHTKIHANEEYNKHLRCASHLDCTGSQGLLLPQDVAAKTEPCPAGFVQETISQAHSCMYVRTYVGNNNDFRMHVRT